MLDRPIDQIAFADLERLVQNGVAEGRYLEYKEELPGGTDEDRREFLSDVSAFANASGGDLIYGAEERRDNEGRPTGTATAMIGVKIENADQLLQRLENMLRDGIAPRLSGYRFAVVDGFPRGPVLVLRVPRSWALPHMVTYKGLSKFFTRSSNAKYQLDVQQIREAFLNSRSATERAEEFRTQRLGRLLGGATPVRLTQDKVMLFHAVPEGALFGGAAVDLRKAEAATFEFKPIDASGWGHRYNIDGLIAVPFGAGSVSGYIQLFRSGLIEVAHSEIYFDPKSVTHEPGIGSGDVLKDLVDLVGRVQTLYSRLEVSTPIFIFITLLGVESVNFYVRNGHQNLRGVFDRDTVLLPDVMMDDLASDASGVLLPALDTLWQAAGFERCYALDHTR